MPIDDTSLLEILRKASANLLYPSESDEPFMPFVWKATESDAVKQIAAQRNDILPLKETSLDDFFVELTIRENGAAFFRLRQTLEAQLTGIRVIRIGEIEVQIHVIGKTSAGNWAGVKTISVET